MATLHDALTARGFTRTGLGGNLVGYRRDYSDYPQRGDALILTNADNVAEYPEMGAPVAVELWDERRGDFLTGFQAPALSVLDLLDALGRHPTRLTLRR